jgi:hypothetical protein
MANPPTPTPKPVAVPKEPVPAPAAEAKPAKEKKAKAPKAEGSTVARPRLPKVPDEHVITVFKENSKARGAAERFQRYHTGMSVKEYVDKIAADFGRTSGQTHADIRWDIDHGFIHVGPTVVPVPAPAPAPAPAASAA